MAKAKDKRSKGLADRVRGQKREASLKSNPFEVKFNKQKHNVLGRKIAKHDRGKPGVARSRAMQKRKETLLQEYKQRGKSNKFVDRRIGEGDTDLSVEEKMLQRFAVEKQKHHEKASLFSLNEEEELTHYGQSLSEIEKFEEPAVGDSDDDDGKIAASIVGEEHFGGFLTKKKDDEGGAKKTWKQRMEEIIAQSKKHKYERQRGKEQQLEVTSKLDEDLKELRMTMESLQKAKKGKSAAMPRKSDDYDVSVAELKFDCRGTPLDRLKTEEEIAREESERLAKLEADRLRRMKGFSETEDLQARQKSADDLDDDYLLKPVKARELRYKDGKLVQDDESNEDDGDDDDGADDDDDDDGEEEEEGDEEGEEESAEDESSEEDAMQQTSDLESDVEMDSEEEESGEGHKAKVLSKKVSFDLTPQPHKELTGEALKAMLREKKAMMEAARKELPYTFKAPETYEELLHLFQDHSESEQLVILERLQKCHHPSLAEGNKEKLQVLFTLLLQYFGDLAVQDPPALSLLDRLTRPLYDLAQISVVTTGQMLLEVIKEKQEDFQKHCQRRGGRGTFPSLDVLMYLKLIAVLFPTSDFIHPVVTPSMLFMSQLITQCPVNSSRDVASGLFVCNLFLEYVSFSKRFVPEAINFLRGILSLALPKDASRVEVVIPPFKVVGPNIDLLCLKGTPLETKKLACRPVMLSEVFSTVGRDYLQSDAFRIHSMLQCLKLIHNFSLLYEELPSFSEIFWPVKSSLSKLAAENYPGTLKELVCQIVEQIDKKACEPHQWLVRQKRKPQPMKQLEPKIEDVFDGRSRHGGSREGNEKQRLLHKVKKERKGAIREIKKDMQFLARQKLAERLERDADRQRKVKKLYQDLAQQEGDYKTLKRQKDRL